MPLSRYCSPFTHSLALAIILALTGCATLRGPVEGASAPSCSLLSPTEVWGYATSNEANPFLAPTGLVRGSPYEFIVLRLSLSLKKEEYVRVSTFSRDAGGNHSTRLYDARELRDLWNKWGDDETSTPHMKRAETIDRWCLPSTGFTRHAGRAEYLIVLVGKKPLPKPVVVDVVVTLGDSEPNTFTFTIAPAK